MWLFLFQGQARPLISQTATDASGLFWLAAPLCVSGVAALRLLGLANEIGEGAGDGFGRSVRLLARHGAAGGRWVRIGDVRHVCAAVGLMGHGSIMGAWAGPGEGALALVCMEREGRAAGPDTWPDTCSDTNLSFICGHKWRLCQGSRGDRAI